MFVAMPDPPLSVKNADKLLVRKCAVDLFAALLTDNPRNGQRMLTGVSGAGKSVLMFQTVEQARSMGWIVVYFPMANKLEEETDRISECREIVEMLIEKHEGQLAKIESDEPGFAHLLAFMQVKKLSKEVVEWTSHILHVLRRQKTFKVLVAVDRFNAIAGKGVDQLKELAWLADMSSVDVKYGVFLTAVSASFNSHAHLRDGDALVKDMFTEVLPYDLLELKKAVAFYKDKYGQLSAMKEKTIIYLTGCVPRLVMLLCEFMDEGTFVRKATSYYQERVTRVWERLVANDYRFAFKLFANKQIVQSDVTPPWVETGLVLSDGRLVCPAATEAVRAQFWRSASDGMTRAFDVMLANSATRGHAFELLMINSIRGHSWKLEGTRLSDKKSILLDMHVGSVVIQPQDETLKSDPEPGTLVFCSDGHSVVDLVLYTNSKSLVFIQISVSAYADHNTKVGDLFSCKMKNGSTVFDTYCNWCGLKTSRTNRKKIGRKIPAYYIYVTSSKVKSQTEDEILLVGPEALQNFVKGEMSLQFQQMMDTLDLR
jgi:hypothetical protein